jgi:hypothetical protein
MLPRPDDGKGSTADAPERKTQEMLEVPRSSSWISTNWRMMKLTEFEIPSQLRLDGVVPLRQGLMALET